MAMVLVGGLAGMPATVDSAEAETVEDARADTLTIGAAHSLKAALQAILPIFEREYGAKVRVVYGPSQILRQQIEKGRPIDVFLPGAAEEVQKLQKKGLTLNGGPRIYAQTSLVLVMSTTSPATAISFHDVLPNRALRIAVADPKTSALGPITTRALAKLDPALKNRLRLLYAQHSEDIVNLVRTGKADAGIVYRVDAINGGQVRIIDEAPGGAQTLVQLGQAVVWTCRNASLNVAEQFVDFIMSTRIQKLLPHYGLEPVISNGSSAADSGIK